MMHKGGGVSMGGSELGREILMQLGTLQLYGMDSQLTPMDRGLVKYSLLMDKSGLMEAHTRFMKQFGELERDWQLTKDSAAAGKSITATSFESRLSVRRKAVDGMRTIRLVELKVGKRNHGRVLYATICVDTFFLSLIQTLVEDDEGHAARVMIDDATLDGSASWAKVQRRYPKGAKVAIKAPFLSDLPDESIALYVNSEEDLVVLSDSAPNAVEVEVWESVDAAALRAEGNRLFAKQDWPGAIDFYTKCIQKAMGSNQRKPPTKNKKKGHGENGVTSNGKVAMETVMLAYSNRAAAWMKLSHYERALKDAGEALHLDPQHLKSIYRKGCALHHMQQFENATECFALAMEHAPEKEIKLAHQRSKVCDLQSRLGVYDIHKYLLGDSDSQIPSPPEYSDFVGPVEIKLMEGKGKRGLFVTRDVEVGELLLVSNALAVVHAEGRRMVTSSGRSNSSLRDELVFKLSNLVLKSSKWLQQMCSLADCDCHGNGKVPPLELFRPNSKWSSSKDDVPLSRIKGVVLQNALDESGSCGRGLVAGQQPPVRQFLGLWPLPSFINHSCASNSFRLHVGDTLFLHASRPIEAGAEVTLAYVNTLLPKHMRHELLEKDSWEFKCNCSRCELETTLSAPLKQVSKRFQSLWGCRESVTPGQAESFKLAKLALKLEHILKNIGLYVYEIQLIRASFFIMYWIGYLNLDRLGDLARKLPLPESLIDAMTLATPGDGMSLFFAGYWLKKFEEQGACGAVIDDAQKRAMHICRCMYGKQKSEILKRLVKAHDVVVASN